MLNKDSSKSKDSQIPLDNNREDSHRRLVSHRNDQNNQLNCGTFSSICHNSIERTARAQNLPILDPISGENILLGSHSLINNINNNKDVFQTLSDLDVQGNPRNGMIALTTDFQGVGQTQSMNVAQEDPSLKRI